MNSKGCRTRKGWREDYGSKRSTTSSSQMERTKTKECPVEEAKIRNVSFRTPSRMAGTRLGIGKNMATVTRPGMIVMPRVLGAASDGPRIHGGAG